MPQTIELSEPAAAFPHVITNTTTGVILGIYDAPDSDDAIEAMARDAGYQGLSHMTETVGSGDDITVTNTLTMDEASGRYGEEGEDSHE